MQPLSIQIFLPSGDPAGINIVSRDDWPLKAIVFPRSLTDEVLGMNEVQLPGVYLLAGGDTVHVGSGDPVGEHLARNAKEMAFWHRAVFFTSASWTLSKAQVRHLETRLIALARAAAGVKLDNDDTPPDPELLEDEHATTESFLCKMLEVLPLLGFSQFRSRSKATSG